MKMIRGIKNNTAKVWSVYVLRCGDNTFYTGIAKDVVQRVRLHNKGCGAVYTKTHLPVRLLYSEGPLNRSEALIREAQIKRLSRPQKEILVASDRAEVLPTRHA